MMKQNGAERQDEVNIDGQFCATVGPVKMTITLVKTVTRQFFGKFVRLSQN
jgi:hypothetical protein